MTDYSGELYKFVSQLATATGDLSKMTAPSFLLNGYSLLEYSLYWNDHPDLFYDIAKQSDQEQMVAVLRWFVSTLYGSFHSRCAGDNSERKPFNPVLGETMTAEWKDTANKGWTSASMVVEQVSHHPPISAFAIKMPAQKDPKKPSLLMQGQCGQKTTFSSGAIKVVQVGRARVTVSVPGKDDVEYTIYPLPELTVAGLLTGKIFVELLGKTQIKSSLGHVAEIEFIPKGWFTGDYFQVKGWVKSSPKADPTYLISGDWTKRTIVSKKGEQTTLFDASVEPHPRIYKPLEQQGELESHKLWGVVSQALKDGDYAKASHEKTTIEEAQRKIRRERKESGKTFTPQYFDFVQPRDNDKEGATQRDPQQAGDDASGEVGHWLLKQVY
ncbi:hypothetical protein EDD86DRAFT_225708 [Gorgonomyces haynaldii]|nr:hypothetical protein EDD86DRAFT_225708 [Gorgonomyces haynaldii]